MRSSKQRPLTEACRRTAESAREHAPLEHIKTLWAADIEFVKAQLAEAAFKAGNIAGRVA
jgi:hypothetical protein